MTLADRLAVRRLAEEWTHDAGDRCTCDECILSRAVLAFVPGEVETPAGYFVEVGAITGMVKLATPRGVYAFEPDRAIALGQALILAGMEADRG